jgi:glutamate racemase
MNKIAFLDSGLGGITVLREAIKLLPYEDFVYYSDNLNAPYGPKTKEQVKQHVFEAVKVITTFNIKALVVACNTATSVAIEDLRRQYSFPIIGMEPAIKPAIEKYKSTGKRILVLATDLSLKEEKLRNLVIKMDAIDVIDSLSLPRLVTFVENFESNLEKIIGYIKLSLSPFNLNNYGAVVLGCTHYVAYDRLFRQILPVGVDIIDGNTATIKHLKDVLEQRFLSDKNGSGKFDFYYSGKNTDSQMVLPMMSSTQS